MEKEELDTVLNNVRQFLNKFEDFKNFNIHAIFINNDKTGGVALTFNEEFEFGIKINLEDFSYTYMCDYDFDFDNDMFKELENNKSVVFISDEENYNIWTNINLMGIDEIECKMGWQKYLEYCKRNGITKEYLDKTFNENIEDMMLYYDENMREGNTIMSQHQQENEIQYITFVLGYDLLNDKLNMSETSECDRVYDFCNHLAKQFVETEYYKNMWKSTYDNLQEWSNDSKELIQSEYLYFFNFENKHILEVGNRGETKVALIEMPTQYGIEYIVAFNYQVDDKKLEWGYGYYYTDLEKAKADFEKIKVGGDLADTFEEKKKEITGFKMNKQPTPEEIIEKVKDKKEFIKQVTKNKKNKERER